MVMLKTPPLENLVQPGTDFVPIAASIFNYEGACTLRTKTVEVDLEDIGLLRSLDDAMQASMETFSYENGPSTSEPYWAAMASTNLTNIRTEGGIPSVIRLLSDDRDFVTMFNPEVIGIDNVLYFLSENCMGLNNLCSVVHRHSFFRLGGYSLDKDRTGVEWRSSTYNYEDKLPEGEILEHEWKHLNGIVAADLGTVYLDSYKKEVESNYDASKNLNISDHLKLGYGTRKVGNEFGSIYVLTLDYVSSRDRPKMGIHRFDCSEVTQHQRFKNGEPYFAFNIMNIHVMMEPLEEELSSIPKGTKQYQSSFFSELPYNVIDVCGCIE